MGSLCELTSYCEFNCITFFIIIKKHIKIVQDKHLWWHDFDFFSTLLPQLELYAKQAKETIYTIYDSIFSFYLKKGGR
jgi:hypothetical protein